MKVPSVLYFYKRFQVLLLKRVEDVIGLDLAAKVSDRIFRVLSNKTERSPVLLERVKKGEVGVKSGKGWYDYSGRTKEEISNGINQRLLRQLALFQACEKDTFHG